MPKIYKKQILFNEKVLNKHSTDKLLLVEGYFDVIKLYQYGFKNCVAPLGTAINHEKLIEITKKGFEIIVCLDGDIAGRNATIRLMNNLLADKNFELGILNPNKSTKTGSNNESKSKNQLLSQFMYNLSFPLSKQSEYYNSFITPKISYRFSPNKTKNSIYTFNF